MKNLFTPAYYYRGLALTAALVAGSLAAQGQGVRIGTAGTPDASAVLDLVSGTKGALLPRVAATADVPSPATGLIVFQTGGTPGYYYNAGTSAAPSWVQLATTSGAAALTASNGLTKTGQNVALGGSLATPTTIAQAGNNLSLTGGSVGIGTAAPQSTLDVSGDFRVSTGAVNATLGTTGSGNANFSGGVGQSFTLPVAASLTSIRLVAGANSFSTTFQLYSGGGPSGTALLTTPQPISFTANASTTAVLPAPLSLPAGLYTVFLNVGSNPLRYFNSGENYTGGNVYSGTSSIAPYDLDFTVAYTSGTATSAFNVAPGGNVGIGTTGTPSQKLDVAGNARIQGLTTAGVVTTDASGNLSSTATVGSADATTASNGLTKTGTDLALGGTLAQATTIATAGNSLSITGTGNVGIGTSTAPTSTLQVAGTTAVGVVMGLAGNGSGTPLVGGGYLGLSPSNGADYYLLPNAASCVGRVYYLRNNSSTNIAYINTMGGLIFDGGAATATNGNYGLNSTGSSKTVTVISDGTNWTFIRGGN